MLLLHTSFRALGYYDPELIHLSLLRRMRVCVLQSVEGVTRTTAP